MRIANIILVHKNPRQVESLIKTMFHADFDFYIHVDKKIDIKPFEYLSLIDQVYFVKDRVVCNWGGYSIVDGIINSIDHVRQSGITYDFVNLLSGQDFPVKPIAQIYSFFSKNLGFSFLAFDNSNDTPWWKETESRYKKFHLTDMKFRGRYAVQAILNFILPKRKYLDSIKLYGGNRGTWWTITFECAAYLTEYLKRSPEFVNFLRFTWGSDEFVVPTVLMNSPYQSKIINESYRYIDWPAGLASPKTLTVDDYEKIISSDSLFARKFDADVDVEIINKLRGYIFGASSH
jgi:Core-2/I-Branching enzyme